MGCKFFVIPSAATAKELVSFVTAFPGFPHQLPIAALGTVCRSIKEGGEALCFTWDQPYQKAIALHLLLPKCKIMYSNRSIFDKGHFGCGRVLAVKL